MIPANLLPPPGKVVSTETVLGVSGPDKVRWPYYHIVPKDFDANLAWRKEIIRLGYEDEAVRDQLCRMCAEDLLFQLNTIGFVYENRPGHPTIGQVPFITWPYQDEVLTEMAWCVAHQEPVAIQKTRDTGASYMLCALYKWFWQWNAGMDFLLGSRKEEYVDEPGDPKTLFWKIDYMLEHEPVWLQPRYDRRRLAYQNLDLGSSITGESCNKNFARGGRYTSIGVDEVAAIDCDRQIIAAISKATGSKFYVSTHQGTATAFYEMIDKKRVRVITIHWTSHPLFSKGLWHDAQGRPRSPWYDQQVAEMSPVDVAREIDIDPIGSNFPYFDPAQTRDHRDNHERRPTQRGTLVYDHRALRGQSGHRVKFEQHYGGDVLAWIDFWYGRPPEGTQYAVACDIAAGTGHSNSVIVVGDATTREKVVEYANCWSQPQDLADIAVAMARCFNDAFLMWEANGPAGGIFNSAIKELNYRNVYFRKDEVGLRGTVSDQMGWWSNKKNRGQLLLEYKIALQDGQFINPSADALDELKYWVTDDDGLPIHDKAERGKEDPTGARESHGDRVIADALLNRAMSIVLAPVRVSDGGEEPVEIIPAQATKGTMAYYILQHQREAREREWDL